MPVSNLTSRADLLRWTRRCQTQEEKRLSGLILGYELREALEFKNPGKSEALDGDITPPPPNPLPEVKVQRPPEQFYALAHRYQYANPDEVEAGLSPALRGVEPLSEADLQPFETGDPIPHQAIIADARLNDFLRLNLSHVCGRKLDVPRLVRHIARLQTLYQLPRRPRVVPAGRIYLILDLNKRMLPFWQDAHLLCERIVRQYGRNGLEIRVIDDNPQGDYWDWFDDTQQTQPWRNLSAQSVVLIVSDLGQLAGQDSSIRQNWQRFLQQLQRQNISPLILAPLSPAQQDPAVTQSVRQLLWNKHSSLKPQKPDPDQAAHAAKVRRVLAFLSVAVHVEPELLRAILGCLPAEQADSGIEAAVCLHADIQWGYNAISVRPECRAEYQSLFKQQSAELQYQVLALIKRHHIGQFPAVWAEEVLNAQPLVSFSLQALADVEQAETFMLRFANGLAGSYAPEGMTQFARRHLSRLGAEATRNYSASYTSTLYGLAYREQLRAGAPVPEQYDAATVQAAIAQRTALRHYSIWQYGETLCLATAGMSPAAIGGVKLADFESVHDTLTLSVTEVIEGRMRINNMTIRLPEDSETAKALYCLQGQTFTLDTGSIRLTFSPFRKPSWAASIAREATGLFVNLIFAARNYRFILQAGKGYQPGIYPHVPSPFDPFPALFVQEHTETHPPAYDRLTVLVDLRWEPQFANTGELGFDEYGLYADLTVNHVTQRFRWIEPGSFMMGSPLDEAERFGHESQHPVTLSQGFWLADTAVTQEFWLAVMASENPSYCKDHLKNPVEQVSWDDAQIFISKLNQISPGLSAQLPSEAQWEYACRAGTTTPFSFGEYITPDQINYNGDFPYVGCAKGLYREKTVQVKSLPANRWGLFEMHGNVWEWCQDSWQENHGMISIEEVTGFEDMESPRVLRGGAWDSYGRFMRSASRSHYEPDFRDDSIGFRLALGRSNSKRCLMPSVESTNNTKVSISNPGLMEKYADWLRSGLLKRKRRQIGKIK
ncbi:formylglycine-generating enzyme family protein [Methylomonas sp. 11b]|uniref:formylglycine-generating enzyme family protein n=1 Tax=Methylomonas sp. 11b TaxID=1168169 RepID=UPI00047AFE92|nr:formylglycine-generating enzyme family protein [Methylomonas sp. 11b]